MGVAKEFSAAPPKQKVAWSMHRSAAGQAVGGSLSLFNHHLGQLGSLQCRRGSHAGPDRCLSGLQSLRVALLESSACD
jgi:hypothetical protein